MTNCFLYNVHPTSPRCESSRRIVATLHMVCAAAGIDIRFLCNFTCLHTLELGKQCNLNYVLQQIVDNVSWFLIINICSILRRFLTMRRRVITFILT